MNYSFLLRSRIVFCLFVLFAFALLSKLFLVQIVHNESYKERADRQYSTPSSSLFERGTIYFSSKDGQLVYAATQSTGYKVAINPGKILNKDLSYEKLSQVISLNKDDFFAKANKAGDPYEEIATRLTKTQADQISSLKISGVSIFKEKWRFYPGENLASQSLGFVAYKENELAGRYGLERQYDKTLARGKDDPYINFFAEVFSNINDTFFDKEVKEGDLITTIEPEVQGFLEKMLNDVKEKRKIDTLGGIIMNPKDGSMYALSVKPDFDVNNFSKEKDVYVFANPLAENVYEFGSVIKPLVMASAIDAGVVTSETKYDDKGFVIVEDKEIYNFDKKGRGVVNMQEVLTQSLNTGMVFVYKKLGKDKMRDYMLSFGINEKSGIDLPNDTKGLISNILNSPRDLEYANAAFGQGIALSPFSTIRALATLANGGLLVTPHIASKIKLESGLEKKLDYLNTPTKISSATAMETTRMLVNVMDKLVQNKKANLENYSIAVKTGTAQIANPNGGGYYEDRHMHSFFGYFPAYDPKFIILLYAVNPKGVLYAAETWTDPFLSLSKFLISYYQVIPDR
ncbi:MAG: penicillin-binding protein 2 [Patescibacteria group bacterium]